MATKTVVERLIIEIGGDSKKFKQELKAMKKAEKTFEGDLKKMAVVGKASFLAIGAAAATLGVVATKAFADFETGITNVAKTTNLQGKELEEFKEEIISLSEEIPVTTDKLLEIATAAGQLGIKGTKDLTKFTEVIAKLGRTTNVDGEEAALTLARLINLTGEAIQDVDKLGSTLVDLGNNFAASEAEILEVAKDVAKATVQFKLSSDEILGISAAMASLAIPAEAGGTVVSKAFQKIDKAISEKGGPAFEKIIELTGLAGDEINQVFKDDAANVFKLFIEGLGESGKTASQMRDDLSSLGLSGIRVNKILPTLASRSDILADAMTRAGIASKDASALNEEAAKAFETAASKMQIAQTKINNAFIALGEQIAPQVIESITLMSDEVREATGLWSALAGAINGTLFILRETIGVFSDFFGTIEEGAKKLTFSNFMSLIGTALLFGTKSLNIYGKSYDKTLKDIEKAERVNAKEILKIKKESDKDRLKQLKDAAKITGVVIKRAEDANTKVIQDSEDARLSAKATAAEKKLALEMASLEQIRRLNKAEIDLLEAQQSGADENTISMLQKRFDSIKEIIRIENSTIALNLKKSLTLAESEQILHNERLLAIEQAKFEGILLEQDTYEADSFDSFKDYREKVEKDFSDNPISIPIETTNADDTTDATDTTDTTDTTGTTDDGEIVIDEGEQGPRHLAEKKRCNDLGKEYNPKIGPAGTCCENGTVYDGKGNCVKRTSTGGGGGGGGDDDNDTGIIDFITGFFENRSLNVSPNLPSGNIQSPSVQSRSTQSSAGQNGQQDVNVKITLQDELIPFIDAKQREDKDLGTSQ